MNEDIDLTEILKDCPKGTKLYSTIYGEVIFSHIDNDSIRPIALRVGNNFTSCVTKYGRLSILYKGECTLFPSKDQRDWSKFTVPWYKKERFNPATLMPFDKVLVKSGCSKWTVSLFSFVEGEYVAVTNNARFSKCIPFNDETKYLLGTTDEAPEYYRYWDKDEGQYN